MTRRPHHPPGMLRGSLRVLVVAATVATIPIGTATAPAHAHQVTPPVIGTAWVSVPVATVWVKSTSPRRIDAPALAAPAHLRQWLRMSTKQRLGLDSRLMTQALLGQQIGVVAVKGDWTRVELPTQTGSVFPEGIVGWMPTAQITTTPPAQTAMVATVTAPTASLSRQTASGRKAWWRLSYGTTLPVGWHGPHWDVVTMPDGRTAALHARDAVVHETGAPARPARGTSVVADAEKFLGLSYLWGGMSGYGFDCSGLVSSVYAQTGVVLDRDAADQAAQGRWVKKHQWRPGDLLFYSSNHQRSGVHHVVMYVGHGWIVHAPQTGEVVQRVRLSRFELRNEYWGARRYLG